MCVCVYIYTVLLSTDFGTFIYVVYIYLNISEIISDSVQCLKSVLTLRSAVKTHQGHQPTQNIKDVLLK